MRKGLPPAATLPNSGGTVSFKYDPFGRRIYKQSPSATSIFAYDGNNLIEEINSGGTLVARYTQGKNIDEPLAESRSGTASYYEADGLGAVTSLSNAAGALAQTYTYDSFGFLTNSTGSATNWFRYAARQFDSETALYYDRARYYDPTTGRFLSQDPLGFNAGVNFYAYADNDPVALRDPFGLSTVNIVITRVTSNDKSTTGTIEVSVDSGPILFNGSTLEPPPNAPQTRTSGPPLPIGLYPATVYNSPSEGYADLLLGNTGSRTGIEIHIGNYPGDTHGCILVGAASQNSNLNNSLVGGSSTPAFNKIMNIVNSTQQADQASGQQTTITVSIGQQGADPVALDPGTD